MTLKIRYMRTCEDIQPLQVIKKGEWVDLALAESVQLAQGDYCLASLGIRVQLPPEYEAWIIPRSGTPGKYGVIQANSMGLIDSTYTGKNDIWKFPAFAIRATNIQKGTRICQFRIMPSMKASSETKKRWLEYDGVEFVEEDWDAEDRGGFGSTGEK